MFKPSDQHVPESLSLTEIDAALSHLFPAGKKVELYQFIGGILCLSQLKFENDTNGYAVISSHHLLGIAADLLGVDCAELTNSLTTRSMAVPKESSIT